MADYGVTDKGFVLKRYDEILESLQNNISVALGFDVSQKPQSLINSAIAVPCADAIATLWEVAQDVYYSRYPSTASGVNLDNACQYGNVYRESSTKTEYVIHVTALDGTVIPKNAIIASDTNPQVELKCAAQTEITRSKCHAITIRTVKVAAGDYEIQLNDKMYSVEATSVDTAESILKDLVSELKAANGYMVSYDAENEYLIIEDGLDTRDNEIVLSNNLTTVEVVGCVSYLTEDYGKVVLPDGSITVIVSNVTGLKSVINNVEPSLGGTQETDEELRLSYIKKRYSAASSQAESIESHVLDEVTNVSAVRVYENPSDEYDTLGRPPHSIEVIVDGGNDDEIANAILAKKAAGIYTYGSVRQSVLGKYGDVLDIGFNRPENVYAWIKVEITQGNVSIDSEYAAIIKGILLNTYTMTIGDSFLSQNYIAPIYEALPGIKFCDIKVATGTDSVKQTQYMAGNIDCNERQVIDLSSTRIEVGLK